MSETNQPIESSINDEDTNNNNSTMNDNSNQSLSMRPAQQNPFQFDLSFLPKLDQLLPENPLFFMQQHFNQQHQQQHQHQHPQQQQQQQQQRQQQQPHQQMQMQDQAMKDANNVSGIAESSTGTHPSHTLMPSFDQSANNGSETNQSIWSGFNNFFSNVAHNPFPQSIPNLAKNVSEYFSNYQLFSSLNHQSGTNPQDPSQIQASVPGIKYESLVDGSFKPPSMNLSGMQIRVLGVPQTGAKSRVETQIKICIQLVTDDGDKAQQWSHLKLPEHMVAKDKLKRQQQITVNTDSNGSITSVNGLENTTLPVKADKMLFLSARVICASDPSRKVVTCLGCIQRERKRSQRRKENKIKTENDDSDKRLEDEQSLALEEQKILLFNCSEIVDFSSGDTILPTRITCYCRHHNERLGFCIYFEMQDHTGKPVATGMSPPIMITDDHKSSKIKAGRKRPRTDLDKPISTQAILSAGSFPFASNTPPPSNNIGNTVSPSLSSSNTSPSSNAQPFLPFNSFTDTPFNNANHSISSHQHNPKLLIANVASPSPNDTPRINHYQQIKTEPSHMQLDQSLLNNMTPTSNNNAENSQHHQTTIPTPHGKAAMVERPQMQRMIPSEGPMDGGIEVTILGAGFQPGLTCMFGDVAATNTHYWSPNTLVCILPPAIEPGAVVVSFKEFPVVPDSQDLTLFTYCNENDRALMELALQVVGLKMTGKVEDARDIAMRIVEGNGNHSAGVAGSSNNNSNNGQRHPSDQQQQQRQTESPSSLSSLVSTQHQLSATLRSLPTMDVIKQLLDDRSLNQNKLCFDWPLIQMRDSPGAWSE